MKKAKRKYESNWKQKTLENLEKHIWPSINQSEVSYLIRTCNQLRKKQLQDYTIEDLRIMIGQEIGLEYLIPLALEQLTDNLFAEGDMYKGDLLNNVLDIDTVFWENNKTEYNKLIHLIKDKRTEIQKRKIKTDKFDDFSIK